MGAKLTSLKNLNDKYFKERDAAREDVHKIRSKLETKHKADFLSARNSVIEEYKSSVEYKDKRDDLYSSCIEKAARLLG